MALIRSDAFDIGALTSWMDAHVDGFEGPLRVERFGGGQSNPTYRLITPHASYVLRRRPSGELPSSAHAVDREYRVTGALAAAGFAVPRPLGLCTDSQVIGSAFYVMEHVDGRVFWRADLPELPREQRRAAYGEMVTKLVALHAFDPMRLGLQDFGRPGDYVLRQVDRWGRLYRADAEVAGRVSDLEWLLEWLPANRPAAGPATLVHGDYRCDNIMYQPDRPEIASIIDWELSTLGHPLADFAYSLLAYRMAPEGPIAGLAGLDLERLGLPSEKEQIARYAAASGRDMANFGFYLVFGLFRLAMILHGIRGRLARGTSASTDALDKARHLEATATLAYAEANQLGIHA